MEIADIFVVNKVGSSRAPTGFATRSSSCSACATEAAMKNVPAHHGVDLTRHDANSRR